jgi:hypothetical protein
MILITPWGDLINWSVGASNVLGYLSLGRYPPISVTGVYGPLQVVLAPFFWIWTQLPIDHPPLASLPLSKSTPAFALSLLMKLPSFIADLATGVLIRNLVRYTTSSERKSWIALLAWYCNPFNTYWIEAFGAVDVIPAAILLLAIMLDMKKKWFSSGLCVAIASILRIFPLFVFPFTLAKAKLTREYASLLSGFLLPLVGVVLAMYASGVGTLSVLASLPQNETWLLDFLGVNLSQYVKLTPVLMVLQFFIIKYYWTKGSIIQCVSVALLTLLVGALPYGGYGYHFLWVSPLLSISLSMNLDEIWVFIFTFVTASLYPPMIFVSLPSLSALEPLFAGAFFAAKATYLTKINVENVQILKIAEPARAVLKSASWSEGVN